MFDFSFFIFFVVSKSFPYICVDRIMKDMEKNEKLLVRVPDLGPKFKGWREDCHIPVERVTEFCGVDIECIQEFENGELCDADLLVAYQRFFFENIPNAWKLYNDFMDEILAKLGYTYDEEGNEYNEEPAQS